MKQNTRKTLVLSILIAAAFILTAGSAFAEDPVKVSGSPLEIRMNPVWSPDGNYLAFTEANYKGIYVMDLETKEITKLTDEASAGFGFEWSSDSKSILSRVAKYEGVKRLNAVKIFDIKTKSGKLLTGYRSTMTGMPQWAEMDQKVYMFNRGKLETLNSGKKASSLSKAAKSRKVFFMKNDHIASGSITTKKYNILDPIKNARYLNMTVSPDGSRIAFEIMGGNMYSMNADGTGLVDLGKGFRPKWSPDSKYLIYMISQDDGHEYTSSDIYTIKYDGTEKKQVTSTSDMLEMNPSWSPDGSMIAFDEYKEGAVYIMEISK